MSQIYLENQAVQANNIYCIGRNYVAHIEELNNEMPSEAVVFMKPNNSIVCSHDSDKGLIRLPDFSDDVHFECELVLLIGQDSDGIDVANWQDLVAGYGVGLDLTARDVQGRLKEKGLPWLKAKGFKGAACVSDFVAADKLANPQDCSFTLHINGALRQLGETKLMIHTLPEQLAELAAVYGLRKGDLVFTGTPSGVGKLEQGDKLVLALEECVRAEFEVV